MAPVWMGAFAPGEPLFFVVGGIVLVGLIGLLFVLRNRRDED